MNIAFCLYKYFPYGGLQRDFLRIACYLAGRGHQIRVYCLGWQGDIPEGFDVRYVPATGITNHLRDQRFIDWMHEDLRREPVDLLVGMNKVPGLDLYYAADSCFEDKARTERGALYRLGGRYRFFAGCEQAVFKRGVKTQILLISETEQQKFVRYYQTEPERMHMLPPGISRDRRAPDNAAEVCQQFRDEFGVADDENLLLFVGSGFIKKGLDRAITALSRLPETLRNKTRLFVIGQDKPNRFIRLTEQLGVARQVRFFQGRDDIPRFLLGADFLIHPAIDEAAGIVLLEAVVAGLPVLVTDVCGYAHHIDKAGAGQLIPTPFDQQAFNRQLEAALQSEEREQWQRNGLAYAESEDLYSLHEKAADIIEQHGTRPS